MCAGWSVLQNINLVELFYAKVLKIFFFMQAIIRFQVTSDINNLQLYDFKYFN